MHRCIPTKISDQKKKRTYRKEFFLEFVRVNCRKLLANGLNISQHRRLSFKLTRLDGFQIILKNCNPAVKHLDGTVHCGQVALDQSSKTKFWTPLTERSTRTADIGQVINTNTLNLTCLDSKRYRLERGLGFAIHYRQRIFIQLHRQFSLFVLRRSVQDEEQRRLREINLGVVSKGFFLKKIGQGLHLRMSNTNTVELPVGECPGHPLSVQSKSCLCTNQELPCPRRSCKLNRY